MKRSTLKSLLLVLAFATGGPASAEPPKLLLSEAEIEQVLLHGTWPEAATTDPSNRVSGKPEAIALGKQLFFDKGLSSTGTVSCATCHQPERGWTDGLPRGRGIATIDRNTQSLLNIGGNRWFGWAGSSDSLWSHSIVPLLDPREMAASPAHVVRHVSGNPVLAESYLRTFGVAPDLTDTEATLANVAKALAAFQETIVSGRTPFDDFRDALARGDRAAAATFPQDAQRGAQLFVDRGKCNFCHLGPAFSNGEFSDAAVPYFIEPGRVDPGRYEGIARLKASPFNRLSRHSDARDPASSWATIHITQRHTNFGEFKVPSLRNLTLTAPYMHNGSRATLEDVIRHYSEIDMERLHVDGEKILEPLKLSARESSDLVAFLKSLSPR
ncbi:MAG: cytochrome-c peroxidase [Bosea sp. (in: a-proteobacteria)]